LRSDAEQYIEFWEGQAWKTRNDVDSDAIIEIERQSVDVSPWLSKLSETARLRRRYYLDRALQNILTTTQTIDQTSKFGDVDLTSDFGDYIFHFMMRCFKSTDISFESISNILFGTNKNDNKTSKVLLTTLMMRCEGCGPTTFPLFSFPMNMMWRLIQEHTAEIWGRYYNPTAVMVFRSAHGTVLFRLFEIYEKNYACIPNVEIETGKRKFYLRDHIVSQSEWSKWSQLRKEMHTTLVKTIQPCWNEIPSDILSDMINKLHKYRWLTTPEALEMYKIDKSKRISELQDNFEPSSNFYNRLFLWCLVCEEGKNNKEKRTILIKQLICKSIKNVRNRGLRQYIIKNKHMLKDILLSRYSLEYVVLICMRYYLEDLLSVLPLPLTFSVTHVPTKIVDRWCVERIQTSCMPVSFVRVFCSLFDFDMNNCLVDLVVLYHQMKIKEEAIATVCCEKIRLIAAHQCRLHFQAPVTAQEKILSLYWYAPYDAYKFHLWRAIDGWIPTHILENNNVEYLFEKMSLLEKEQKCVDHIVSFLSTHFAAVLPVGSFVLDVLEMIVARQTSVYICEKRELVYDRLVFP